jgi:hypothetical protein
MQKLNAAARAEWTQAIDRWLDDHGLRIDVHARGHVRRLQLSDLGEGAPIRAVLSVMWSGSMTQTAALRAAPDAAADMRLLLLGPHVSSRGAAVLREAGIHHIDAAGNAWLRLPGVVVDIRGRSTERSTGPRGSDATQSNLFSSRRAQVAFALISWPDLVTAPIRRIATAAHVSVGLAHETMGSADWIGCPS